MAHLIEPREVAGFTAPSRPPPLLSRPQLYQLCREGYVNLELPLYINEHVEKLFTQSSDFSTSRMTPRLVFPFEA